MARSSEQLGRLAATAVGAVGVVLWATETMLVTLTTGIPPLQTVAIAFLFAASMSPVVWLVTGSHPLEAFRQPLRVWILTVGSLVGYHSCIYYATQQAPPAAAALLQSTTPLMIVLASAFLPGERLHWWHVAGALLGFAGVMLLIDVGAGTEETASPIFYLSLIGIAAGLWGLYSVATRLLPDVPSTALGVFYAVSSAAAFSAHFILESWVAPQPNEWLAMAALGIFPMGLAIYFWDFGLKKGDLQALGAFSYVEPFIGALIVALGTGAALHWSLLWSGLLVVGGAVIASASLWKTQARSFNADGASKPVWPWLQRVSLIRSEADLKGLTDLILGRLKEIDRDSEAFPTDAEERRDLLRSLAFLIEIWEGLDPPAKPQNGRAAA